MKTKLLHETDGARTWALIYDTGDEVMDGLSGFAREEGLDAASFTGIGALSDVKLGYFDWEQKDYLEIPLDEQVEVLTLAGDVAVSGEGPQVHAHLVVGLRDGAARGGHLLEAHVRPTLEVVLTETPSHLRKEHDPESGLALISIEGGD